MGISKLSCFTPCSANRKYHPPCPEDDGNLLELRSAWDSSSQDIPGKVSALTPLLPWKNINHFRSSVQGREALFSSCSTSCLVLFCMLFVCKVILGHLFRNLPGNRCSEKKHGKSSAGPLFTLCRGFLATRWRKRWRWQELCGSWCFCTKNWRRKPDAWLLPELGLWLEMRFSQVQPLWGVSCSELNKFSAAFLWDCFLLAQVTVPCVLYSNRRSSRLRTDQQRHQGLVSRIYSVTPASQKGSWGLRKTLFERKGDLLARRYKWCVGGGPNPCGRADDLGQSSEGEEKVPLKFPSGDNPVA